MIYADKQILTKEQAEALWKLALEIEEYEIKQATDEQKDVVADYAQIERQGAWRLISAAFDERK